VSISQLSMTWLLLDHFTVGAMIGIVLIHYLPRRMLFGSVELCVIVGCGLWASVPYLLVSKVGISVQASESFFLNPRRKNHKR